MACNLRCKHCGSTAGRARTDELSTAQCLDVARQLSAAGCELMTLSGGEPTLRSDWDVIAGELRRGGTLVNMVTNGMYRDVDEARSIARRALDAGMPNVGVSIDGPKAIHDDIRALGSFEKTCRSVETFLGMGLDVAMMTAVNRLNFGALQQTWELARSLGVSQWRVQLAKPMGNLDQARDLVLSRAEFVQLIEQVAQLKARGGLHVCVGDSLGYYGKHEEALRRRSRKGRVECWQGCQAGLRVIGIEANGNVKGCLSLQAFQGENDRFVEGNLREQSLAQIWERPGAFAYNRQFDVDALGGACRSCSFATQCRGGARCVSAAFDGVVNEDRYCYTAIVGERLPTASRVLPSAAALAAGLLLSVAAEGCQKPAPSPSTPIEEQSEPSIGEEYGIREPLEPSIGEEYGIEEPPEPAIYDEYGVAPMPEYGVRELPAIQQEYGIRLPEPPAPLEPDPAVVADYGIRVMEPNPAVMAEYGIPPHAEPEPAVKSEYGVYLPPEPEPEPAVKSEYGVYLPPEPEPEPVVTPAYGVAFDPCAGVDCSKASADNERCCATQAEYAAPPPNEP